MAKKKRKQTVAEAWREFRASIEPEVAKHRAPDVLVGIQARFGQDDPPKKAKDL